MSESNSIYGVGEFNSVICKHCGYSIGIAKFGEFIGRYIHVLTGNLLCALSAEPIKAIEHSADRTFTQAEVDARVATERALFAQKFQSKSEFQFNYWLNQGHAPLNAIRMAMDSVTRELSDPNALAEHDAALREALKLQTEVFREQKSKLEAENAGLRESLEWALDWVDTSSCDAIEYEGLTKARTLLGEKP